MESYILLTLGKNEGDNLEELFKSIDHQILKPSLWIFINDGSTDNTEEILNSLSNATTEVEKYSDAEVQVKSMEESSNEPSTISQTEKEYPLFEITELNGIDDKMTRGMAKKIYTAGKRAKKSRMKVITDIRESLKSAGKLDDPTAAILANLESNN